MRFEVPVPEDDEAIQARLADILQRAQELADSRKPDGHYAEYQDKVAFSVIDRVPTISIGTAPQVIENVVDGIRWGTTGAVRQLTTQVHSFSSLFNRALLACFDEPDTPETAQVFTMLGGYVAELPVDVPSLEPVEQVAWIQRLRMLTQAYECVLYKEEFDRRAFNIMRSTAEMAQFKEAYKEHLRQVNEVLKDPENVDLATVVRLIDAHKVADEHYMSNGFASTRKSKTIPKLRNIPVELYRLADEAHSTATVTVWSGKYFNDIEVTLLDAWEQSQENWTWQDASSLLSIFAEMESHEMRARVVDALEDITDTHLAGNVTAADFPTKGMASLIHADIVNNASPMYMPERVIINREDALATITYGGITLPRFMVPVASIGLLEELAEKTAPDTFIDLAKNIQRIIYGKPSQVDTTGSEWLLTLALLRQNPRVQATIDRFIASDDFPHQPFSKIIAGERPGRIYLLPDGQIRAASNIAKGWVLATSPYVAREPEPAPQRTTGKQSRHSSPDPGVPSVPGIRSSKKSKKGGQQVESPPEVKQVQTLVPIIELPNGETLESLCSRLTEADRKVVARVIAENQQDGRHPLIPLRSSARGATMRKMQVNGIAGGAKGIRIVLTHTGHNRYTICRIDYRGAAYKDKDRIFW